MEKINNLAAVLYKSKWSDLGDWESVWRASEKDSSGLASSKNALAIDCKDSLLRSESSNLQLVGLGLDNIVAVAMPDAVLISKRDRVQDVRNIVKELHSNGVLQAEEFPKDYRPWGWFEVLISGDCFKVKRIYVKPGAALSLQKHKHRSEHWVVVEGTAEILINGNSSSLIKGESVFVPREAPHRIQNKSKSPIILIEVQIGDYLGEDDIIRYDDIYSRA